VTGFDHETIFHDVWARGLGVLEHPAEVYFVEATILHAFEQMGAQFELPLPPLRPLVSRQTTSESVTYSCSFCQRPAFTSGRSESNPQPSGCSAC
jgi:hypothetical protein